MTVTIPPEKIGNDSCPTSAVNGVQRMAAAPDGYDSVASEPTPTRSWVKALTVIPEVKLKS